MLSTTYNCIMNLLLTTATLAANPPAHTLALCLSLSLSCFLSAVNMLTRTAGKAQLDKAFSFLMLSINCENFQRIAIEIDYICKCIDMLKANAVGC